MLSEMQLKNGLRVFFFRSNKAPVVSSRVWVKTGSADEQKGEEGLSHFIEHLVFKGSRNLNVGDAAKMIEGSGGQLNAYTSFDETVFHVTQHKDQFEVGLEVLSEMLGYPSFESDEVDNEREVVLEEIKRSNDNPGRQSSRLMFSTVYKKHSYGVPVIGYAKNIETVSNETIRDYFSRRYVPENMFLIVSGDFEISKAKKYVKKYFADIPAKKVKNVKRQKEPEQKRVRVQVQQTKLKQNLVNLSWPIPKIKHKDIAALDMLTMVLGQSESSIFNQLLRLKKASVRYAYSSLFATKDSGFLNMSLSADKDKLAIALNDLLEALEYFMTNEWDKNLIEISRSSLESDEIYPYETVDGISRKIGYYQFNFSDVSYSKNYLEQVSKLKVKDLYRVFKKYLDPNKLSVTVFAEQSEKELEAVSKNWIKNYRKFYKNLKTPKLQESSSDKKSKPIKSLRKSSGVKDHEEILDCGARLYIRQTKDVPIVNMRVGMLAGLRFEPADKSGVSELMSQCWGKETEEMTEAQQLNFTELRSSSLASFCGKNTNGMSMTTLSPHFDDMFNFFWENFNQPKFSESIIEREKVFISQALLQQQDNPAQLAVKAFMSAIFGDHPYGRSSYGTIESIKKLNINDIKKFYESIFDSSRLCISLSGDLKKLDILKEKINNNLSDWNGKEDRLSRIKLNKLSESKNLFKELDKQQTHLLIGYPGFKIDDPDRYKLDIMQSVLAGQGGRLFLELRDKHSMAYSLSPMRMDGLDGGFFGAYIACSPEKASKAIEMLDIEFEKLMDTLITDTELKRSQQYLIGKYHIELQKNSAFTSSILFNDIYGISSKEVFKYKDHIMQVTKNDVRDLARSIFKQKRVMSAVGKTRPW